MNGEGKSQKLAIVFLSLGLGANLAWCTSMGHAAGFFPSTTGFSEIVNPRTLFLVGILITSILFTAVPGFLRYHDKSLRLAIPLLAAGGTACYGISYSQNIFDPLVLASGGLIIAGLAYFWFVSRFVLLAVRTLGFKSLVWSVVASLVIMLLAGVLIGLIESPGWQIVLAMLMPVFMVTTFETARFLLMKGASEEIPSALSAKEAGARTIFGVPARGRDIAASSIDKGACYIILVAGALLLAVIRSLGALGTWGNTGVAAPSSTIWIAEALVISVCLAVFAFFALARTERYSIEIRFIPAMAVIFAGLFIAVIQMGSGATTSPFFGTLLMGADSFAHLLFWCIVAASLERLDVPSFRVIGIAGCVYAVVSMVWVILSSNTTVIDFTFISLTTYGLLVVALLSVWVGIKRSRKATGGSRSEEHAEDPTEMIAHYCEAVSDEYLLSPREREVLFLLAQGRTRTFIKDELVLSGNTVKTHITHIYTKMGVSDRQEMMDRLWQKKTTY